MSIAIFWIDETNSPQVEVLEENELLLALSKANAYRDNGMHHVVISTDFGQSVGKAGVSDVLPEGYDWKKRRK